MHISPLMGDKMCSRVVYFFFKRYLHASERWLVGVWMSGWSYGATASQGDVLSVRRGRSHSRVAVCSGLSGSISGRSRPLPQMCHHAHRPLSTLQIQITPTCSKCCVLWACLTQPTGKKNIDPLSCLNIQLSKNGNNIYLV